MKRFDKVYTVAAYYDGPRGGIADFGGKPHVWESVFDDLKDGYSDTFLLMPIDEEVFRLAMEDWDIWCRWEEAFYAGRAAHETHPALPEDRARHEELTRLIGDRLVAKPASSIRAHGEFRTTPGCTPRKTGHHDLEVRWTVLAS